MRILILGAPVLNHGFKALSCDVLNVGDKPDSDVQCRHPMSVLKLLDRVRGQGFTPDVVLYCDSGNMPQFFDLEKLPCPSAYYSIDTYCNPWHIPFGHAFDRVFVAQKDYAALFAQSGIPVAWLPLFFCSVRPHYLEQARDIPLVFVGNIGARNNPDRRTFLDAFRRMHPLVIAHGDYVPFFNRSQIALNQTAVGELNFRCFEALACGAALLMEECANGLYDLFTPGEHILPVYTRGNVAQAAARAKAALSDPETLARIAGQGRELVERKHSDVHRAADILQVMQTLLHDAPHVRRLLPENLPQRSALLASAYVFLASELKQPDHAQHRDFFLRLARSLDKAARRGGEAHTTVVHAGQRPGALSWPAHWQAICERIASEKATLKIVTKTKNEVFFIEKWIQHHKRICDGARLIIFDNMSTDADVFEIYNKYTNDILVFSFDSYVDTIHMYNFFGKMYTALQQSCDFFTSIDSDEFLYGYDDFRLIDDNRVVKTLQDENEINIFIPAWVDTLPGSENVFKFDPDSLYPFHFSKPIINTRMLDAIHAGHELHHAIQLPALAYGCAPTGFVLLHMKNLNKKQRIQANMEKLVSCGFIRHNKDFASVLNRDVDKVPLPHMRAYVHEIRNALHSPAVPTGTESGDPDMATALVEIGDDGSLRFASPELRAAFARCVGMETDYFERIGFVPARHADSRHTIRAALKLGCDS